MEEHWERRAPTVTLDRAAITELLRPAFSDAEIATLELLGGGLVNTNYWVTLTERPAPIVLRVYTRDHEACAKEANILNLVHGDVPTPEVLYADSIGTESAHPYLVLSWVEGVKPHHALHAGTPTDTESVGYACGVTLAAIGRYTFPTAGFLGPDLTVAEPFSSMRTALQGYIEECLAKERVRVRLGADLANRLGRLVTENAALFDELESDRSLVHSDYKAVNLLLHNTGAGWTMAGVLDWEFAHAGTPMIDLGILLRDSARLPAEFERGVTLGFRDAGGALPQEWRRIIKLVDLVNLCDFLASEIERGAMLADVTALVQATVDGWNTLTPKQSL